MNGQSYKISVAILMAAFSFVTLSLSSQSFAQKQLPAWITPYNGSTSATGVGLAPPPAVVPTLNCPAGDSVSSDSSGNLCCYNEEMTSCDPVATAAASGAGPNTTTPINSGGPLTPDACAPAVGTMAAQCGAGSTMGQAMGQAQRSAGAAVPSTNAVATCMAYKGESTAAGTGMTLILHSCVSAASACAETCNTQATADTKLKTTAGNNRAVIDSNNAKKCSSQKTEAKVAYYTNMGLSALTGSMMVQCDSILQANAQGLCGVGSSNSLCNFNSSANMGLSGTAPGADGIASDIPGTPAIPNGADMSGNLFNPGPSTPATAGNLPTGEGNGSGGMAAGGGYPGGPGGPNGGAGGGGAQFKTDIGGGLTNGSGYGTTSIPTTDNSARGGNGGSGGPDKLDLACYLPGGNCDPASAGRGPASANELATQGITGANDLSNFEKVTRMMNKKRSALLP